MTLLSDNCTIQKITSVELHSRLRGRDFQHSTASWLIDASGQGHVVSCAVDHEIVIIAMAKRQLLIVVVDASAYFCRGGEVERRSFDGSQFTGRNKVFVHGSKPVR